MVERHLAKVEVAGSSPVIRSIKKDQVGRLGLFLMNAYIIVVSMNQQIATDFFSYVKIFLTKGVFYKI